MVWKWVFLGRSVSVCSVCGGVLPRGKMSKGSMVLGWILGLRDDVYERCHIAVGFNAFFKNAFEASFKHLVSPPLFVEKIFHIDLNVIDENWNQKGHDGVDDRENADDDACYWAECVRIHGVFLLGVLPLIDII